jgi:hypothetical protein
MTRGRQRWSPMLCAARHAGAAAFRRNFRPAPRDIQQQECRGKPLGDHNREHPIRRAERDDQRRRRREAGRHHDNRNEARKVTQALISDNYLIPLNTLKIARRDTLVMRFTLQLPFEAEVVFGSSVTRPEPAARG